MPRKKAADHTGQAKTRSRAGCSQCRASHVRCDTKKPVCTRCQEKGLACSTQLVLKWESEFASRGLAFGRAGIWNKSKAAGQPQQPHPASASLQRGEHEWCSIPSVEPWGFVNSVVGTFERPYELDFPSIEAETTLDDQTGRNSPQKKALVARLGYYMQLTGPPKAIPLFPYLSQSNYGHVFEYYVNEVCPRTTASSRMDSPFASVIMPFCLTASPTIFKAIQALGACYWSRSNPTYTVSALRLKSETVTGLRNRLAAVGPLGCSLDPEILVIMMMLCLYELVDHCDRRWTVHLKGAKELIRLRREQALLLNSPTDAVTSFAEHFFAFQDVMGRTACGEKALFGADYWQENDHKIDLWMGCSPELVSILSSVTELSWSRRQITSDSAQAAFSLQAATFKRQLEELTQDADDEEADLHSTAEMKRLAALLYLHCALFSASPSTKAVVNYVQKVLKFVSGSLDSGSIVSLSWPVFVAAVELDPLNDEIWRDSNGNAVYGRPLVLRALEAMSQSSVSSVARTRAVIVKVWQARDNDMSKASSRDALNDPTMCNDWEWYVAPVSIAMSLA